MQSELQPRSWEWPPPKSSASSSAKGRRPGRGGAPGRRRHATCQQTDAALHEQASLQTAVLEAHALCEAFDSQLRASATQLTEREVFVCVLLAELSAVDLQNAAGAAAAALSQATHSDI